MCPTMGGSASPSDGCHTLLNVGWEGRIPGRITQSRHCSKHNTKVSHYYLESYRLKSPSTSISFARDNAVRIPLSSMVPGTRWVFSNAREMDEPVRNGRVRKNDNTSSAEGIGLAADQSSSALPSGT